MIDYGRYTPIDTVVGNMVEITFPDGPTDGFRKVKETLQRMGVPSRRDKSLIQSCHILHKRGKYYICHFKELFAADGKPANVSDDDLARRNLIVKYLIDWGMVETRSENWKEPMGSPRYLKVIKYSEKDEWTLSSKYQIGVKRGEFEVD